MCAQTSDFFDSNPTEELCELKGRFVPAANDTLHLQATLRINVGNFVHDYSTFTVSIKVAYLKVHVEGFSFDELSRYGERVPNNRSMIQRTKTSVSSHEKGNTLNVRASSLSPSISGSHNEKEVEKSQVVDKFNLEKNKIVQPTGGNIWKIQPDSQADVPYLADTYLNYNDNLCTLIPKENFNRTSASMHVYCYQKDIDVHFNPKTLFNKPIDRFDLLKHGTRNFNKVFAVFLAKTISCDPIKYAGICILSKAESINNEL